jgi:glycosyltransferase involved in cell wall biosynthesis
MSKPSICFIVSSPFTVNGFLIGHLRALSKLYEVTLCVNLNHYQLSPDFDTSSIKLLDVPLERKISLAQDLKSFCMLFKIFRSNEFQSIHSITPKAGLLSMMAGFFARIPNRFHTFTGQIWSIRKGLSRSFYKFMDCLTVKFATFVFADSSSQINFLLKERVCDSEKIGLLGFGSISGVDLEKFNINPIARYQIRKKCLISKDDCVFLFVGRLCKDKGVFDLLKAFNLLRAKYRHIALWIVGPDEEQIEVNIKSLFPELHSIVNWIGPSFYPQSWMAAADILVLPSYREGFGSVIIEAASCGIPAIAYRIDGVVDAVVDGETGILVDAGDVDGLVKQMQRLITDTNLRSHYALYARTRTQSQFSSKVVTNAWLDFYANLFKI